VADDPLRIAYHDLEWGVPAHHDRLLFEFLLLEGAQAGLSWDTILRKREGYRRAYDRFDPRKVARYSAKDRARLLANPCIVRNRSKVTASITNARLFLEVQREFGSFDRYLWSFVGGKPIQGERRTAREVPARTAESDALSKDLKRRGFKFVGSTICYAFMQAVGLANDHTEDCFRARQVRSLGRGTLGRRAR
jgi:DNA-3-methyladenine glycosylase I